MNTEMNTEDFKAAETQQAPTMQDITIAFEQENMSIRKLSALIDGYSKTSNDAELQQLFKTALLNFVKL